MHTHTHTHTHSHKARMGFPPTLLICLTQNKDGCKSSFTPWSLLSSQQWAGFNLSNMVKMVPCQFCNWTCSFCLDLVGLGHLLSGSSITESSHHPMSSQSPAKRPRALLHPSGHPSQAPILVSCGRHDELPPTWRVKTTEIHFLPVLNPAGSRKSRCQRVSWC